MRKPFDIKYRPQIESGEFKVETRNGESVRIICWDKQGKCPIVTVSCVNGDEGVYTYYENGQYTSNGGNIYDLFIITPEEKITEFEEKLVSFALQCNGEFDVAKEEAAKWSKELLALAKKELAKLDEVITLGNLGPYDKGFRDGKAEAMADLERTYFSNPEKLPKWLKDDITRRELNAHTKGYNKGYEVASKLYDESVAYHFPIMPTPPSGWGCDGTHCTNPQMDCINCPRRTTGGVFSTSSGTSTATLHGNTSATDGKEHNPSFID